MDIIQTESILLHSSLKNTAVKGLRPSSDSENLNGTKFKKKCYENI